MKKRKYIIKAAALVLAEVMLLTGCGQIEDEKAENAADTAVAETDAVEETLESGIRDAVRDESNKTQGQDRSDIMAQDKIDYPFPYGVEGWRLVLCTDKAAGEKSTFCFRMYNEEKNLVQEFPCELEADELIFRFDKQLYNQWASLAVYPEDAETSRVDGLLFTWNYEEQRFDEDPIEIPWYDEVIGYHTFLVTDRQENGETRVIYRLDSEIRQPIELRDWILTWDEDGDRTARLYIWDCIAESVIYDGVLYDGKEAWKAVGRLANDEYYQELFLEDLQYPGSPTVDETISTAKYITGGEDSWHLENIDYESREALLIDCGFQDAEPYYQYFDRFGNLELELYFDENAGRGCGFRYSNGLNYELEKVIWCIDGFIFEGISSEEWEDDSYSLLTWGDREALEHEDITQVLYEYTDDEKISSYEVRGLTENTEMQWWEGMEVTDDFFLSIDWVYRSDGTLYRKYYNHNSRVFGTAGQSQWTYYDESGRPVYRHEYITHGSHEYYYIYDGENAKPNYCLLLDRDGSYSTPAMIVYR